MAATSAWRPIGHVLVDAGAISPEDLELALIEQRRSGRRLGEVLIDSGRITWLQLANAIADQARDLEVGGEMEMVAEPEMVETANEAPRVLDEPPTFERAAFVPVSQPPVSGPPPQVEEEEPRPSLETGDAASRLETVEAMLKERQRAFLELVSVTERLRATVAKLQDEIDERNAEIMKLRANRTVSAA